MMSIIDLCIYAYWILKPFYIGKSGTLQISDAFIVIAFFLTIGYNRKKIKDNITSCIQKKLVYFVIFIICVFIINTIYFCIYKTQNFITSTVYYVYILMGVYTFSFKISDRKLMKNIYYISFFNIILQLVFAVTRIGRFYGNTRYEGTFNDPNQFGFFIVMMLMYIYLIGNQKKEKKIYVYLSFFIGIILIFMSGSTGMLLAIATFFLIQIWLQSKYIINIIKNRIGNIIIFFIIIISLICIFLLEYYYDFSFQDKINNAIDDIGTANIIERIEGKLNKANTDKNDLLEDRHLEQIINNPWYCLFGAGQGNYYRFADSYNGEIHSTLPSILFYYGIIPTIILLHWIYINLKGMKLNELSVYIALFVESFTLINQRQLMLWILIIYANICVNRENNEDIRRR